MKLENVNIWMVRCGSGSALIEEFINKGIAAIGWNDLGELPQDLTYGQLKNKLSEVYPDWSNGHIGQSAGQIWRFFSEFKVGDKVVTYDSNSREYYRGTITSGYSFDKNFEFHHFRKVDWEQMPTYRDSLNVESRNILGSILTIFALSEEIWVELEENDPSYMSQEELDEAEEVMKFFEEQELQELKKDAIYRSTEFIKDIISHLSSEELEQLAAGILRGMGYKTRLTPRTHDLGSDIIASKDGLEMTDPVIKVEVKHKSKSKNKVSAPEIRSFIGGLRGTIRGIYISSTGFTKEANYEAERANFTVTLLDLDRIVDLITEYYEDMDTETKALVPLKKIYWPV